MFRPTVTSVVVGESLRDVKPRLIKHCSYHNRVDKTGNLHCGILTPTWD